MEKEKLAYVRKELIDDDLGVPVGDYMYSEKAPLPYRWVDNDFQVLYLGKWRDANSIDWNFEEQQTDFDCDNCDNKDIGETYQDKTGNTFVCQDCFDKSNDGTYFVPTIKIVDQGVCVTDEELQEEIKLSKAQNVNSIRNKVTEAIQDYLADWHDEDLDFIVTDTVLYEIVPLIVPEIFKALDINTEEQEQVNPIIVINPKVKITVKGGVAFPDEVTAGIHFSIDDQD